MSGPTLCVKLSEKLALKLAQAAKTAGLVPEALATVGISSAVGTVQRWGYLPNIDLEADILEESDTPDETKLFRVHVTPELAKLVKEAAAVTRLTEADVFIIGARLLAGRIIADGRLEMPMQLVPLQTKEVQP